MPDLLTAIQSGSTSLWLFIPIAVTLGALHALEPGHSKTMMTAFLIAVRGTVWQAVLLGISAALSHSAVIWLLAAVALQAGEKWNAELVEPYLQLASGICVAALATRMFFATRRDLHAAATHHHHDHHHGHPHGGQIHPEYQDAHEREHAEEIERRFAGRSVTTPQIILFGITGGLAPCPAAFSVLLICLQLKRIALGLTLVASFSAGLALVMVSTGVLAVWGLRHAQKRLSGFSWLLRRAPCASSALLLAVSVYMIWHGWHGIHSPAPKTNERQGAHPPRAEPSLGRGGTALSAQHLSQPEVICS